MSALWMPLDVLIASKHTDSPKHTDSSNTLMTTDILTAPTCTWVQCLPKERQPMPISNMLHVKSPYLISSQASSYTIFKSLVTALFHIVSSSSNEW